MLPATRDKRQNKRSSLAQDNKLPLHLVCAKPNANAEAIKAVFGFYPAAVETEDIVRPTILAIPKNLR